MYARMHTHTRTALNIITVSCPPISLSAWQLNSVWNNVSGIILPLSPRLFGWLCRGSTYRMMSPVSRGLISAIKPFLLSVPPAPEWWGDDCKAFKDTPPRFLSGLTSRSSSLRALSLPSPRSPGTACPSVLPHAAFGTRMSVASSECQAR